MSRNKRGCCGCGCLSSIISLILSLVLIALVVLGVREAFYRYMYPVKYETYVSETSAELGVPETLIYSVIQVESGFDPEARSEVGARGLMQITEETFEWLKTKADFGADSVTFEDLDQPDVSIAYGTYFLKMLLEEFDGDVPTAMSAYHAGRGSVHSWLEQKKYSENGLTLDEIPKEDTKFYVQKILRAMKVYDERLNGKGAQNENVARLQRNVDRFLDAYVVPLFDGVFEKIGNRL